MDADFCHIDVYQGLNLPVLITDRGRETIRQTSSSWDFCVDNKQRCFDSAMDSAMQAYRQIMEHEDFGDVFYRCSATRDHPRSSS